MALLTVDYKSIPIQQFDGEYLTPDRAVSPNKDMPVVKKMLTYTNDTGGALAANSIIALLPVDHCRLLGASRVTNSAFGAGVTIDMGLQEYTKLDGTVAAADIQALLLGLDVSAAQSSLLNANPPLDATAAALGVDVQGQSVILVQILGGPMPINATLSLELELLPYRG